MSTGLMRLHMFQARPSLAVFAIADLQVFSSKIRGNQGTFGLSQGNDSGWGTSYGLGLGFGDATFKPTPRVRCDSLSLDINGPINCADARQNPRNGDLRRSALS